MISAYHFFREHAGYIVGERAKCAIALARSESSKLAAIDSGTIRVEWQPDFEPYDPGDCVDSYGKPYEPETVETCVMLRQCECCGTYDVVASLSGIDDADDNYRRVIEAELYSTVGPES